MSVFDFGLARAAAFFLFAIAAFSAMGVSDTLRLPEALVKATENDGFRYEPKRDSLVPLIWRTASLGALLEKSASIDVRSYGNASLQTLSFRGAQAQHTRVLWQDLELNGPTLGLFDFSAVQCVATDALQVLPGMAGLRVDNGALGGTVVLGQSLRDSTTAELGLSVGAFGMREIMCRADIAAGKVRSTTRFSYRQSANNYSFDNYTVRPWRVDTLTNAGVVSGSLVQGISYRPALRHHLQTWLWLNGADRALPGTLLAENVLGTHQKDNQVRAVVSHDFAGDRLEHRISLGLTHDFQHYASWFESRIRTDHVQAVHRTSWRVSEKGQLRSLMRGGWEHAVSDGFISGVGRIVFRHTLGWEQAWGKYFSTDFSLSQWLFGNARDWMRPSGAIRFRNGGLTAYVNGGSAVRFPTLNDLFWQPGGNRDLRSEKSITAESGSAYEWKKAVGIFRGFSMSANAYLTDLTDLIAWIPGEGYWSVVNINEARMTGAEFEMTTYLSLFNQRISTGGSFGYTKSTDERTGLQLPYVPLQRARLFVNGQSKKWLWGTYFRFMGERPVNAAQRLNMPSHAVADISVQRTFDFKKITGIFGIELMNALDASYQVMAYMPMPGRHANIKINILW